MRHGRARAQPAGTPGLTGGASFADIAIPALISTPIYLLILWLSQELPALQKLDPERRRFIASCISALCNALVTSPLVIPPFFDMLSSTAGLSCAGDAPNFARLGAPSAVATACGLTCGYFIADSVLMLMYPKSTKKELGGASGYAMMWMHHVLSLLIWPYSLMYRCGTIFVAYFLLTEVTNIGQNLFLMANRGKIVPCEMQIGVAWALSFFAVRIIPVPLLLRAYYSLFFAQSCGLTAFELVVGITTLPIPICLNLFWFYKIISKAQRMMSGGGKPSASYQAVARR